MTLRPCSACARHVRAHETHCPFCRAELASEPSSTTMPGRLSRAALFTFRTTIAAAALAGCGPTAQTPPETTIAQPYGAPPNPDPIPPTTVVPPPATDPGAPMPMYGAPAPVDPVPDPGVTAPPTPTPTPTTHAHPHHAPDPGSAVPAYGAPASAYGGSPDFGPEGP